MFRFLLSKFLRVAVILLSVTLIIFLLMHAIPGSPWNNYSTSRRLVLNLGGDKSLERTLADRFGVNQPLWRQFTRYVVGDFRNDGTFFCGVICGNLGPSIQQSGRSVQDVLFSPPKGKSSWNSPFGYSIRLVFFASLFAVGIGIPFGIISAARPKSTASRAISVGLAALISIPNFVLGLLAVIVLASWLKLIRVLPDWNQWTAWIVPAVVLAVMPMASIARVTKASLMNIMSEEYVRTARAKGLTQARVVLKHVLSNALVPMITFMGPTLMEIFTGLFVVEGLYAFPGFGREYWNAVLNLDYPMILGLTLLYAIGFSIVSILVDILTAIIDPRIRAIKNLGVP